MLTRFLPMKKCLKPGIIVVLTLDRMRTKVGLKPEEYTEKDTNVMNIK